MKLPEKIQYKNEDGEVLTQDLSEFIKLAKGQFKVKDVGDKKANDVVKDIFTLAFRAKGDSIDLPEEVDHLRKLADWASEIAKEHREIVTEQEQEKKDEREKKSQEKALAKEAKEKEEKEYVVSQDRFTELFVKKAKAAEEKTMKGVTAAMKSMALPATITMADSGMGVVLADNASKDDVASAAAAMVTAAAGNLAMQGALQFVIGDLVNAGVDKKIFRTKGDACKHVKFLVEEKLGKKLSVGNIGHNSLMSERIPAGSRKLGIAPSLYYFAAKVVAPKLKDVEPSKQLEMNKKFDEERNNVIELVNRGKIDSNSALNEHVNNFKVSVGIEKKSPDDIRKAAQRFLKRLFFAIWSKENLVKDNSAKFLERGVDRGGATIEYTQAELSDIEQEAMNNLQNILLANEDVAALISGEIGEGEGEDKKKVPYYLEDPFSDEKKEEVKKGEEKTDEQVTEEEEEEEEEAGEEEEEEEEDV